MSEINVCVDLEVNVASYFFISRAPNSLKPSAAGFNTAISLLVFTTAVFRAEVALLLGPLALQSLVQNHTSFRSIMKVGLISGLLSLGEIWPIHSDINPR